LACENCEYEELFDPETKEVTMMPDDPNYHCDVCHNTLGCCCTCVDTDELQDEVNDLKRENKELKERLDHLEWTIIHDAKKRVEEMRKQDESVS